MSSQSNAQLMGGCSPQKKPKKTIKNQKKPSQFTNFGVATGFFWFFLGFFGFFGFFWFFWFFLGWFSNPKFKCQQIPKKPKKTKKNQKKPKKPKKSQKTSFQLRMLAKAYAKKNQKKPKKTKKNQKKPKKTKKNQFPISYFGQNQCQKNQKKPKKPKKNQCQFGNFKKPKKTKKNQKKPMPIYRFWCSDWFFLVFLGEHPPINRNYPILPEINSFYILEKTVDQYREIDIPCIFPV